MQNILLEVPVGVSGRHVHLTREHLQTLFGPGYELTKLRDVVQPGQFAAKETVTIVGPKGVLEKVRVLGPLRSYTQVEISRTDSFKLGVNPPIRDSGDHEGSPGCVLVGPAGVVTLKQGVIIALRHIHMHTDEAKRYGLKDKDLVTVQVGGERGLIFTNVLVRVNPNFRLEFHVDTDEANACLLNNNDMVQVLTPAAAEALGLVS
ncbi:phosphate propanoyltransferase [Neomoorella thermoacetica]|uniref:Phosphate propanoyltransferase n=3 Tax=Neomoorella thermoacetica TaxID=1525 RepID=A0A1D7XAH9_NEOTH|nr:phosphate propanoyltransferase [Moorella thermoacetica]AKX96593.1 phosphate propanoyltransferase [Moorella thermoacetica]AOQ23904.1 Phosphate propanoyltransferase [Moorella thermoacetica]APC08346.1 phosphate propanoyltransferase [Moorella thermoacetica]OIQ09351.1 phosphate propanoyltransferase [Moorella thermoacetica]OIQ12856.1 phosphate propanoyltransferase [Moorella thermoacetica]